MLKTDILCLHRLRTEAELQELGSSKSQKRQAKALAREALEVCKHMSYDSLPAGSGLGQAQHTLRRSRSLQKCPGRRLRHRICC